MEADQQHHSGPSPKLQHVLRVKSRLATDLSRERTWYCNYGNRLRHPTPPAFLALFIGLHLVHQAIDETSDRTPGNLGVRVRKTKGLAFWTLAIWRDNQAIRTFVPPSPHKEAMQSCLTGAMKRHLPTGNKTRLIGRRGKRQLKSWRSRADWSRCCIHRSDTRQENRTS